MTYLLVSITFYYNIILLRWTKNNIKVNYQDEKTYKHFL